jgi:hypothetical protein
MDEEMSIYKCEEHRISVACLNCVKALKRRHDKMKQFLLIIIAGGSMDENYRRYIRDVLKEIGEL